VILVGFNENLRQQTPKGAYGRICYWDIISFGAARRGDSRRRMRSGRAARWIEKLTPLKQEFGE
jgi:hypothetical protein